MCLGVCMHVVAYAAVVLSADYLAVCNISIFGRQSNPAVEKVDALFNDII